jgi:hypothetical protein
MATINNQDILDQVEDYYLSNYPDEPQQVDEALGYAQDLIYGTGSVPPLSQDGVDDSVSADDYRSYGAAICTDGSPVADVYNGDEKTDPLFYDVRDLLDDILQTELGESALKGISLWGECPKPEPAPIAAAKPVTAVDLSPLVVFEADKVEPAAKKPVPKVAKPAPVKKPVAAAAPVTPPAPEPEVKKPKPQPHILSHSEVEAFCMSLGITPGGGDVVFVGHGYSCEFNYDPDARQAVIIGDDNYQTVRLYPKSHSTPVTTAQSNTPASTPATSNPASTTTVPDQLVGPVQSLDPDNLKSHPIHGMDDVMWRFAHGMNPLPYSGDCEAKGDCDAE